MPERIPLSYPLIIPAYSAVRYMATNAMLAPLPTELPQITSSALDEDLVAEEWRRCCAPRAHRMLIS